MRTLILILTLASLVPFLVFAQEAAAPPKTYGEIYASIDTGQELASGAVDKNGRLYMLDFHGNISIFSPDGKIEKKVKFTRKPGAGGPILPLPNGDIFVTVAMSRDEGLVEIIDETGKIKNSIVFKATRSKLPQPLLLRNGNIAYPYGDVLYVLRPDLSVAFKFKAKSDVGHRVIENADGSLFFSDSNFFYIMDPSQSVKAIELGDKWKGPSVRLLLKDGTIVVSRNDGQSFFFDKTGKQLASVKEATLHSIELPNGTLVAKGPTHFRFLDGLGQFKTSYLHDSKWASQPFYVGKNVFSYVNSSEIVFVNEKAEELGTLPFEHNLMYVPFFLDLGQNRFVIYQNSQPKIIFVRH